MADLLPIFDSMIQSFEAGCLSFDSVPDIVAVAKSRLRDLDSIKPEHHLSQLGVDLRNDGRLNGIQISKAAQDDITLKSIRTSLLNASAENIAFRFPDRDLRIITSIRTLFDPRVLGQPPPYPARYSFFFQGKDVPDLVAKLDPASSPFFCLKSHFESMHVPNSRSRFRPLADHGVSSSNNSSSHASSSAAILDFDPFQSFSSETVNVSDPVQQLTNPQSDFCISQLAAEYPVFVKLYCKDCAREIQARTAAGNKCAPSIVEMASNFLRKPDLVRPFPSIATLFEFSMVICVTAVNCERGFSPMKLFMPYLRNRMRPEKVCFIFSFHL